MSSSTGPTFEGPPSSILGDLGTLTLGAFLLDVADRFSDREAAVFDDPLLGGGTVRWSYAELGERSMSLAQALVADGLPVGGRIGILMGNRPEAIAAIFGAALAGGVPVPLSTFAPEAELGVMLHRAEPHAVLTQTMLRDRPLPATSAVRSVTLGSEDWAQFLERGRSVSTSVIDERVAAVGEDDDGLVLFSSGTSAEPKGMVHRHRAPTPCRRSRRCRRCRGRRSPWSRPEDRGAAR